jgi:hypothetical protein
MRKQLLNIDEKRSPEYRGKGIFYLKIDEIIRFEYKLKISSSFLIKLKSRF